MNRLKWFGIIWVERFGWQSVVGLALLVSWAAFYLTEVYPVQQRLDVLRITAAGSRAETKGGDQQKELEIFRAFFRRGSLEEQLQAIHDSGKSTGIAFKRIDYRMLEEKRSGLKQYQIIMPVTSSYPSIRQFTSLALAKMPALSLDHIYFQRKKIGDAVVEAELHFTLFLADPV
ncbi:MAG TPA: hypothetical protein VE715_04490 [Blastocatellia bacterium]|nr:hypothetical protein [Blastocatellia bacterium]